MGAVWRLRTPQSIPRGYKAVWGRRKASSLTPDAIPTTSSLSIALLLPLGTQSRNVWPGFRVAVSSRSAVMFKDRCRAEDHQPNRYAFRGWPRPIKLHRFPLTPTHLKKRKYTLKLSVYCFFLNLKISQNWKVCFHYPMLPYSQLTFSLPKPSFPSNSSSPRHYAWWFKCLKVSVWFAERASNK